MSLAVQEEHVSHRCTMLGGSLVDVGASIARASRLCQERGYGVERAARVAVSEQLLAPREDSEACKRRLIAIWQPVIVRWCRGGAGARVNAEDAAHDALIRLFEQLDRVRDPSQIHGFVWGLVWRVLREHERIPAVVRWVLGTSVEREAPSLEAQIQRSDRLSAIHRVLEKMSLSEREILWLTYAEGMHRREVAELLGIPQGTLNRRLTRARARFEVFARRAGLEPEVARG